MSKKRVLFIQYTAPGAYPPLEHISRILVAKEWSVLFLGIKHEHLDLKLPSSPFIEVRELRPCPPSWRQKLHYASFIAWVLWSAIRWRPDWVYASDLFSSPAALILKKLLRLRTVYHEHDTPATDASSLFMRLVIGSRKALAHCADVCVIPNERRAAAFSKETRNGINVRCVWNCPSQDEAAQAHHDEVKNEIWLLYHGSIVPARLPLSVLDSLAVLPNRVKLRIAGYETIGHQGYLTELRMRAAELGLTDRIELIGSVPLRSDLLTWCRKSDIGLAFMPLNSADVNEQAMVGASNKPFDYLACGLPLIVSDLTDWRQMFVDTGFARFCNPLDSEGLRKEIEWFLEHPKEMRKMGEKGRQQILTAWNYETQFAEVYQQLSAT